MELYVNNSWTERYGNAHIAEAIACSENGNHATIYTVILTAEEANAKLMVALRELKLMPEMSKKPDA
jgi:ribosome-binding factor A